MIQRKERGKITGNGWGIETPKLTPGDTPLPTNPTPHNPSKIIQ